MTLLLYICVIYLKFIYFFIKIFTKQKKQVFFLSRQYSKMSYNYKEIIKEIKKNYKNIEIKVICQKINNELNESLRSNNETEGLSKILNNLKNNAKNAWQYFKNLHIQMFYIAQSKVIVVDGYNIPVSVLKHKKNTTIIQLWHALAAIKKFGYQSLGNKDGINPKMAKIMKMHANYDYIISGSKAMNPIFAEAFNTPEEKVLSIGTPYVDYLLKDGTYEKEKAYKKYPILKEKINILYSPTFRKNGRDNIEEVIKNIDLDKYNLIITCHDKDEKKKIKNEKVFTFSDIPYKDLIKIADWVITDYSALSVEASIVGAKLLFYVYDYEQYKEENGINVDLFSEFHEYTSKDIKDLVKVIENEDYDMENLERFKNKYVTNLNGTSTKLIAKLIAENIDHKTKFDDEKLIESCEKEELEII